MHMEAVSDNQKPALAVNKHIHLKFTYVCMCLFVALGTLVMWVFSKKHHIKMVNVPLDLIYACIQRYAV